MAFLQMLGFSEAGGNAWLFLQMLGFSEAGGNAWWFLQMLGFSEADSNPRCLFSHKRLISNPDN
jgi:hypothetical protein